MPQLADLGEDLVDIALAVHDVNEPGQTRPDGLEDLQGAGADAEQPLETLLLLDGQVAYFVVALLPELRTHPEVQVADAEQTAEGIQEQGGVSGCRERPEAAEEAQSSGSPSGVVEGGAVGGIRPSGRE